jgi:tetratricopeptide (TPR) repeat protein
LSAALVACSAAGVAAGAPQNAPPQQPSGAPSDPFVDGQMLFKLGRYAEAEHAFATACEHNANAPQAWAMLGRARQAQWLLPSAIEAYERCDALQPNDARILLQLGACHFDLQQLDVASKLLRRVVAMQSDNSRAHMFLARIAVARGDDASAEREFALAVAALDPDPIAPFHQGLMFLRLRRLDEARKAFELALQLIPDLQGAHMNLGLVLERMGKHDEAEQHLARFRELQAIASTERAKTLKVSSLLVVVNKDIEAGNYEAALAPALEARDVEPAWPAAHQMLARIYTALGRKDESAREIELANAAVEEKSGAGKTHK